MWEEVPFAQNLSRHKKLHNDLTKPCDMCKEGIQCESRRGAVVKSVEHSKKIVSQHLSGAGSSPAGSICRDLNSQKLHYQYLTTSAAVVLVVR